MTEFTPEQWDAAWRRLQREWELPEKLANILAVNPRIGKCKLGDGRFALDNGYCSIHQ